MKFLMPLLFLLASDGPHYDSGGTLQFPADYREWVFLSSGLGMTYGAAPAHAASPMFDNVFVNPSSYRAFLKSGAWPNGTQFILEIRNSESHGSINKDGHYQTSLARVETEVKTASGDWKFYTYAMENGRPAPAAKLLPENASCYSCHGKNTAVENTFVQFYPQLMEVAERRGTVKKEYVR